MADSKISALPAATVALAGTEVLPIVQSSTTKQVSVANLTAGRAISATQITLTAGNVIPANGYGVDFSATPGTGTSELFADYEEGTWNATLSDGTNNATMSFITCSYTKIGRTVTFNGLVGTSSVSGLSGALRITGLPFTVGNNTYSYGGCTCTYADNMVLVAGQAISAVTESNTTYLTLYKWSAITGTQTLQNTNWSNTGLLLITGTYLTT